MEPIIASITRIRYVAALMAVSFGASVTVFGQAGKLTAKEAKYHVGQSATVCGTVVSWRVTGARGNSTFLDLDKAYPHQPFSVVIWARNRLRFGDPEVYRNHDICVIGQIGSHRGTPEMIISDPTLLTIGNGEQSTG